MKKILDRIIERAYWAAENGITCDTSLLVSSREYNIIECELKLSGYDADNSKDITVCGYKIEVSDEDKK